MKVIIHKSDGSTSTMRLIPNAVRRKSDGKLFAITDKIERRGKLMHANVRAVEPTPLEDLPGDVAARATDIVKVGEVSARKAFGLKRMFEAPVPFFEVVYTPQYEGFKASFSHDLMFGVTKNDEWEFVYPDVDDEIEKWKGITDEEADEDGSPRSDHRALYVSHEIVDVD